MSDEKNTSNNNFDNRQSAEENKELSSGQDKQLPSGKNDNAENKKKIKVLRSITSKNQDVQKQSNKHQKERQKQDDIKSDKEQNNQNEQQNKKQDQNNSNQQKNNNQQSDSQQQNAQQNQQKGPNNQQNGQQQNNQQKEEQHIRQKKNKKNADDGKQSEEFFSPISAEDFYKQAKAALGDCFDIVIDKFKTQRDVAVIIYIDGLVDKDLVDRDIIRPLKSKHFDGMIETNINAAFNTLTSIDEVVEKALEGNTIVYYENSLNILAIDFKKWDKRSVDTPEAEGVTRGPKEGYTENLLTNLSLIRRKLKTPNLTVESVTLGRQTNTRIAIVYLKDIVNQKVLKEVKKRIGKINVDNILETGQIEQLIEDKPFSIISGMGLTQKPDVTVARILEGRVAIICDGTPHALTIPELFVETLQKSEDYYTRTMYANFIRILRIISIVISILLPGFAVAVLTYSQEMVPFVFLTSFIQATRGTPLPEAAELFLLAISFELLKEAGLRMPKAIGSAITIVGALILGEVAVSAGIVGAPSVIIIAMTSVASLLIVNLNEFVTIYRFVFLFLGTIMGVIGIAAGILFLLSHLASTKSFGVPVLATFNKHEMKDTLIRAPLKSMRYRPLSIVKNNKKRMEM